MIQLETLKEEDLSSRDTVSLINQASNDYRKNEIFSSVHYSTDFEKWEDNNLVYNEK